MPLNLLKGNKIMRVDEVYLVNVFLKTNCKKSEFKKVALVYKDLKSSKYIDLETKEKYEIDYSNTKEGNFCIISEDYLVKITNIINFKRKNVSKRKILQKYKKRWR